MTLVVNAIGAIAKSSDYISRFATGCGKVSDVALATFALVRFGKEIAFPTMQWLSPYLRTFSNIGNTVTLYNCLSKWREKEKDVDGKPTNIPVYKAWDVKTTTFWATYTAAYSLVFVDLLQNLDLFSLGRALAPMRKVTKIVGTICSIADLFIQPGNIRKSYEITHLKQARKAYWVDLKHKLQRDGLIDLKEGLTSHQSMHKGNETTVYVNAKSQEILKAHSHAKYSEAQKSDLAGGNIHRLAYINKKIERFDKAINKEWLKRGKAWLLIASDVSTLVRGLLELTLYMIGITSAMPLLAATFIGAFDFKYYLLDLLPESVPSINAN
ncbi:MAG: hypothetical protein H0X51_09215 [Parachlamydiaceae bacterium]|nr:hypothetical protein [Parachlamydiaceae bacterium]